MSRNFKLVVPAILIIASYCSCNGKQEISSQSVATGDTATLQQGQALQIAVEKMLEVGLLKNEMNYSITAKKFEEKEYWAFRVAFLPESIDHEFTVRVSFDGKASVGR